MGNSALKSHLETSQKTGVFQLTGKGLQEVGVRTSSQVELTGPVAIIYIILSVCCALTLCVMMWCVCITCGSSC